MRIVIVSDRESTGGAAIAATRLAQGLTRAGHEVFRIVSTRFRIPMRFRSGAVSRRTQRTFAPWTERRFAKTLERLRPDVINLHNLHNAVTAGWSDDLLAVCRRFAPVVWTLHDMWSFTGRCAYSGGCERYLTLCDANCPTPHEYPAWPPEHIADEYRSRESALADAAVVAVAPSQWLVDRAQRGLWRNHRVAVIRNGVDLSLFHPREGRGERRTLLVVAHDFLDPRKGMHRIASIASAFPEVTWLAMGKNAEKLGWGSADVRFLGEVAADDRKAEVYSSADALVHAASDDNLPNTIVEALACGTPVIALDRGGVGEIVRPGVSGWLTADPALFEQTIRSAHDDLRASSRALAEAELGVDRQAREYERLFTAMCSSRDRRSESAGG